MNNLGNPMTARRQPKFRLNACHRCGGDAFFDASDTGEWRCLQCARPLSTEISAQARDSIRALMDRQSRRAYAH